MGGGHPTSREFALCVLAVRVGPEVRRFAGLGTRSRVRCRLREDFSQSRMRETLSLFRELLELPSCESKTIIVLLNKLDLFKEKLASSRKENFQKFFTDYKGTTTRPPLLAHSRLRLQALSSGSLARTTSGRNLSAWRSGARFSCIASLQSTPTTSSSSGKTSAMR